MSRAACCLLALVLADCERTPPRLVENTVAPRVESWPSPDARLTFVDARIQFLDEHVANGGRAPEHVFTKRELASGAEAIVVAGYDPYYQREKRFWAVPLLPILHRAWPGVDLTTAELVMKAEDGYTVPIEAARLSEGTAYLALADADHPASWEPIGPRRADPSPFYLVWKGPDRVDLERYPRPWALARIERVNFEAAYPHTVPENTILGSPPRQGYELFRRECIRCHAINREGGRVGPELNVPRSIVEYRPVAQIREYIRNPMSFRYGAMPAHPHLTDKDLDALVAYFEVMRGLKHDPDAHP